MLDFEPVVKLFTADGNAIWLLTELTPDRDLAIRLCDLGLGEPELRYVSLVDLTAARGPSDYRSSAICTFRRRDRSRPTPNSPASTGASSSDPLTLNRRPSDQRFFLSTEPNHDPPRLQTHSGRLWGCLADFNPRHN